MCGRNIQWEVCERQTDRLQEKVPSFLLMSVAFFFFFSSLYGWRSARFPLSHFIFVGFIRFTVSPNNIFVCKTITVVLLCRTESSYCNTWCNGQVEAGIILYVPAIPTFSGQRHGILYYYYYTDRIVPTHFLYGIKKKRKFSIFNIIRRTNRLFEGTLVQRSIHLFPWNNNYFFPSYENHFSILFNFNQFNFIRIQLLSLRKNGRLDYCT